ncbi:Tn3 family transposase [Streptomyces europaeiscabiei]|uniref:Tn3 family transposase n=1 Tax=Streptomyces europaeiscabiei TaxID=146819 RepID=UPI002279A05B|nr:Tn3 family transposase [Streptomyces europaeiscabiei]MDX2524695.1 Tn3 family transposase [Streptomyces europaeiscabiei]
MKRVAVTGKHGESEPTLRRVRHLFVNRANMRAALVKLVNATFAARDEKWWGTGTACASDSRKFGAWSSNLMTAWHQRYRGPGVMIHWHVEEVGVHLLPAQELLGLRGRLNDRVSCGTAPTWRWTGSTPTPTARPSSVSPPPTCSTSHSCRG